MFEMAHKDSLR